MLSFIITVIKLLIILGVVATIHEFGHFIFSKMFKVGVNEFSIGFGPKIFQKKYKDTMYSLRWIPLGGYCAIEGEEGTSSKPNALNNKNIFQKILIFMMGAGFNAILAFIIFFCLSFSSSTDTTKIEKFYEDSISQESGLMIGDKITKIGNKKVSTFSEILNYQASDEELDGVKIEFVRDSKKQEIVLKNSVNKVGYIGVTFKTENENYYNVIDMVASGGPAFEASLKAGDEIVSVGGVDTKTSLAIVSEIKKYPETKVDIVIKRDGQILNKEIVPISKNSFDMQISKTETVKTNIYYALISTKDKFVSIIGSYIDLFTGKVGIKDMSGIVGIGEIVSKSNGFIEFLSLLGMISLAVGVANILPFPPLDGGKIIIAIGETIARKKLPEKAEMIISYVGFAALIVLTVIVTYRDIIRIV